VEVNKAQREALEIWKNDPFTRWYLEQIDSERDAIEEKMGRGGTVNMESVNETAMKTTYNFGYVRALDFCTVFETEEDDGQDNPIL
jgi:hypothetical protein